MLTGLELRFMGVTLSNSGLFSTPGFLVSPVGKRGMGEKKTQQNKKQKTGRREKGNRKGKEGRRNRERDRRQDKEF